MPFSLSPEMEKGECHRFFDGTFFNPWSSTVKNAHEKCSSGFFSRAFSFTTPGKDPVYPNALSTATLDSVHGVAIYRPNDWHAPPPEGMTVVWLGHSCVIVQFDNLTILTDPSLDAKCGSAGAKRIRSVPCQVEDIKNVDIVLLTCDRHEFLSKNTVKTLLSSHEKGKIRWYCGLGIKKLLEEWGCEDENVTELDWWGSSAFNPRVSITFVPAQNWSGRGGSVNKTLWGCWAVKGPTRSFLHVGATGYCQVFPTVGTLLGPFSFATVPIAGYESLESPLWCSATPRQAVKIHQDVKSEKSLAIHWGTWVLSREPFFEPKRELEQIIEEEGFAKDTILLSRIGKVFQFTDSEVDMVNTVYESRLTMKKSGTMNSGSRGSRFRKSLTQSKSGLSIK